MNAAMRQESSKSDKCSEVELERTLVRFRLSQELISDGIWDIEFASHGKDHAYWYSPQYRVLLGFQTTADFPDSLESWSSRLHPSDKNRVVQDFNQHLSIPDRKYDVEARMRCADGVYRWFRSQGSTHRSASGAPLRTVGVMTNIQAEKDRASLIEQQAERRARLEEGLARINGIVGEIRTISRQTTMLAFNAAIEVTRVGEVGQGFGVLANELKILAQRINTATLEASSIHGALSQSTDELLDPR